MTTTPDTARWFALYYRQAMDATSAAGADNGTLPTEAIRLRIGLHIVVLRQGLN